MSDDRRSNRGDLHVVALSGGKDSTALALRLRELYPDRPFVYACTPTGDELPDMEAHWQKLARLLGQPLLRIGAGYTLNDAIERERMLPNWRARWCTRKLKIEPFQEFVTGHAAEIHDDARIFLYVGLRADEEGREGGIYTDCEVVFPFRDWGWGLADVRGYLADRGVTIPRRTDCARCFFQRPAEWWRLWLDHPDIFESAVQQEIATGHTFISPTKGGRWAVSLTDMRERFERREIPANADANIDLFEDAVDFEANKCRTCTL